MNDKKMKNSILKQSVLYRFILIFMFLVNGVYVSIEIYRANIIKPLLEKSGLTRGEYTKVASLSRYAEIFERVFIVLAVVSVFLLFMKKYKPLIKSYMYTQLIFLTSLFVLNMILSKSFDVPAGSAVLNLITPFALLIGVFIYFVIKTIGGIIKGLSLSG